MAGDQREQARNPDRFLAADHRADGAPHGFVLMLDLAAPGILLAVLADGRWTCDMASAVWPPASDSALPASTARALGCVGDAPVSLQLRQALDSWPWERELASAGVPAVVPRYLTDLPEGAAGTLATAPLVVVVVAAGAEGSHLAQVQAARLQQRPLVVVDAGWPAEQRLALERALRIHWRGTRLASQSLALALAQLGLPASRCRLYGDGPALPADAEHGWRPATALSIDLVKSTQLLRAVGAERYAQRLQIYYERCRDVIVRLEGSLDDPQGDDGLMAYFGFPVAVEDAAARALTAGWQLSHELDERGLEVRIGIASGQVAVSGQQAFGDHVHLAARLRAAAQPGQILVARSTRERVGAAFQFEPFDDALELKDYGTLEGVSRLGGVHATLRSRGPMGDAAGGSASAGGFVGRQRELALLRRAWSGACAGRQQWLVVQGEAGIGKTRLLNEFTRELHRQGARCVEITGQAHAASSPFAAVLDALRRHWVAAQAGSQEDHDDLSRLLASERGDDPVAAAPAQRRFGELLLQGLRALVAPGPLCLLVDDAHWLDPSSVQLLQRLCRACANDPLLVVSGERSESGRALPPAGSELLELQGLEPEEAYQLVDRLGGALPERARRRIVERAEGVPLYLEESLRMLGQGAAQTDDEVPATLEDLLMVRLDALGPDRAMAQLISVLGRACGADELQSLLQLDDPFVERARRQGSIAALLDSGLLQALDGPPAGYRFKHALIRDAAYGSIWTHDRLRLHGLCADLIELDAAGGWPQRPEQLAHHLQAAGRAGPAARAWQAAAQLAAARHAHQEAVELAQRALSLPVQDDDDTLRARREMQLQLLIASARIALQGYGSAEVEAAYLAAERAGHRLADTAHALRIRLGLEACFVMRGDLVRAAELARSAVAATAWDDDARLALQSRWALANVQFHQGDWRAALAGFDECLAHYGPELHRRSGVQDPAVMCLGYSSWVHFELGQADEALHRIDRLLALADQLQHPFSSSVALGFAASVKRLCGDVEGAWPHAQEAVRVGERGGFQVWLAHAWMVRGQLRSDRGDTAGGDDDLDRGYAAWVGSGARISCSVYLATRAELMLRQGRTARAADALAQAWQVSEQIGEHYYQAELLRLQGLAAWQSDQMHEAQALLHRALALATAQGKPGLQLRCALSLGALLAAQGFAQDAAAQLRRICEPLSQHGSCRDARWASQALACWSAGRLFEASTTTPWEPM